MPDYKTIYMTGQQGGFFKFVSKRPSDMSEGQLYAAKILIREAPTALAGAVNTKDPRNSSFEFSWLLLGNMAESSSRNVSFPDMIETEEPNGSQCPKLTAVHIRGSSESMAYTAQTLHKSKLEPLMNSIEH